eukprot:351012-Chlamydomonas_euryale.AAC.12
MKQRAGRCHKGHAIAHGPEPPHTKHNTGLYFARPHQGWPCNAYIPDANAFDVATHALHNPPLEHMSCMHGTPAWYDIHQ